MQIIPMSRPRIMVEEKHPGRLEARADGRLAATPTLPHAVDAAGTTFRLAAPAAAAAAAARPFDDTSWRLAVADAARPRLHPWDAAHELVDASGAEYAEPDLLQKWVYTSPLGDEGHAGARAAPTCSPSARSSAWPPSTADQAPFGWHLGDAHSQLRAARTHAGPPPAGARPMRIGILDTGYDPDHATLPANLLADLGYDFVDGDFSAADPCVQGFLDQCGHGTATLAILAGKRFRTTDGAFDEPLGGAPHVQVVPIRIANSVVHFFTSAMADGIEHAVAQGCKVISISMGGVPSRRWAKVVNAAYDAGVAIFAAAGNNILDGFPTRDIVWPARFGRVTAVCGATYRGDPYYLPGDATQMQGNFGPDDAMDTAMAAYTPNITWARIGCDDTVDLDGKGTSSATPQAAAAAALWLQHHRPPPGAEPWQRVEAVRHALFSKADRSHPQTRRFFGQGVLRARDALDVAFRTDLPRAAPDHVWLPLLNRFTGFERIEPRHRKMLEVESAQLLMQSASLATLAPSLLHQPDDVPPADRKKVRDALAKHPAASQNLRAFLAHARP